MTHTLTRSLRAALARCVLFALPLAAAGCHSGDPDGARWRASHPIERIVELELDLATARDLRLACDYADIDVVGCSERPHAVVRVRERYANAGSVVVAAPGESPFNSSGSLHYVLPDGREDDGIVAHVDLWLPEDVIGLVLSSGTGDVAVRDLAARGDVRILCELGDIQLERVSTRGEISVESRLGDLDLIDLTGALDARSTRGDVLVERLLATFASVTSQTGDLVLIACQVERLDYGSDFGDVNAQRIDEPAAPKAPSGPAY